MRNVTNLRTALSLVLLALFAVPVAAGAAVTATTISEPVGDPSVLVYVEPAGMTLKVSGTSNGGNDRLDLRCEGVAAADVVVDGNVRPTAAGVWTTTFSAGAVSSLTPRTCYLHAVPHNNNGANRTAFPGKRVMFQRSRVTAVVGGPNNGVPYDFRYWAPQLNGRSIWQSFSDCGLAGAATTAPDTFHYSASAFPCAGFVAPNTSGRAGVLVDRVNTFTPYGAATLFPGSANALGLLALQSSVSTDPSTGNVLIRETDNMLRCSPDPNTLAATAQTCSSFVAAGVRLDRVIVQQGDGRQALVTDTWSATDGRHHEIDVFYEHRLGGTSPVVSFPWAGGFVSYPPNYVQKPPPTAPFSFFMRASAAAVRRSCEPAGRHHAAGQADGAALQVEHGGLDAVRAHRHARDALGHPVRVLVGDRAGRSRDADRPGRARPGPDPLPGPEPGRQDARRRQAPTARRALQGRQGQARDLAQAAQGSHHPAGPASRYDAAGRKRRRPARELAARLDEVDRRYSVEYAGCSFTPRARATHWLAAIAASPRPIVMSVILPS